MENFIVAALTASLPDKYENCIVVAEGDVIAAVYSRVYGPAGREECERWIAENETRRAEKSLRPKVYTERDKASDPQTRPDGFLQKIVKYIPSEIVAAYVAIANILQPPPGAQANDNTLLWIFIGLLILTPIYTYIFSYETGKPRPIYQTVVAPIAFASWVFALPGNPLAPFTGGNHQSIGSVVLILVLIAIPMVEQAINIFRAEPQRQRQQNA